ncbi:MAG: glycosyl hydrolase [bacterium]|nr:glycosyl hydrolase [bacterium]
MQTRQMPLAEGVGAGAGTPAASGSMWMKLITRVTSVALVVLGAGAVESGQYVIGVPPAGKVYHGVYPGGVSGAEDDITPADVDAYEAAVGRTCAWVYFSHNWYVSRAFPSATVAWIGQRGAVPYIRLMIRRFPWKPVNRRPFRLRDILAGALDEDVRAWGRAARDCGTPLLVEYGTEMNGWWFPWNAKYNGGNARRYGDPLKADGAERFRDTFRRLVTLVREAGASNITWVFHVNWEDDPQAAWNRLEEYYPGDDVVDWVAISAYGPQTPLEQRYTSFCDEVDAVYGRVQAVAPTKPVIIAEFGACAHSPAIAPEAWAAPALEALCSGRWARVIGFSWWNENWQNDNHAAHDTVMRVQDIPALGALFRATLGRYDERLQCTPVIVSNNVRVSAMERRR